MQENLTLGQAISDSTGRAINDVKAQLAARKSTAMKLAHERNPRWFKSERNNGDGLTYPRKRRKMSPLARKHISKGKKLYYKRIKNGLGADKVIPVEQKESLTIMAMVADRIAAELLKRMK